MTASALELAWAARTDAVRVFRERAELEVKALRKEDAELADLVEAGLAELAELTVHELWRTMAWLGIDQKMRADVTTPELMARWPWTVRGSAGGALFKQPGGPSPRVNWPGDAAPADVARWMWLALKDHDHPLADDDGNPTNDPDASDLVRLARDGRLPTLARKMAELRSARVSEAPPDNPWWWWPPPPSGAGTMLPAVRLEHPDGGDWWWWPTAVADLFLAERGLEAQRQATDFAVPIIDTGTAHHAKLPKAAAGMSWAIGAPGLEISRVRLDGDEYALEPAVAPNALVPRAWGASSLLPADYVLKPHQASLPLLLDDDVAEPVFAVTVTDATQYAIDPMAGKVALLILAAAGARAGLARIRLGDLTQQVNPDAERIKQSHHATVAKSLEQLRTLWLYLPDGRKVQCFDVPVLPWTAEHAQPDMEVFMGLHPAFQALLAKGIPVPGKERSPFNGEFLINLSGAMALPTKRSGLLRHYVRAAATWNAYWKPGTNGEPDPSRIPSTDLDQWAAMTNSLSPAAVDYLRATGQRRKELPPGRRGTVTTERKRMLDELDDLEERGLVRVEKQGHKIRLLPPDSYLEAWHQARRAGARPKLKP